MEFFDWLFGSLFSSNEKPAYIKLFQKYIETNIKSLLNEKIVYINKEYKPELILFINILIVILPIITKPKSFTYMENKNIEIIDEKNIKHIIDYNSYIQDPLNGINNILTSLQIQEYNKIELIDENMKKIIKILHTYDDKENIKKLFTLIIDLINSLKNTDVINLDKLKSCFDNIINGPNNYTISNTSKQIQDYITNNTKTIIEIINKLFEILIINDKNITNIIEILSENPEICIYSVYHFINNTIYSIPPFNLELSVPKTITMVIMKYNFKFIGIITSFMSKQYMGFGGGYLNTKKYKKSKQTNRMKPPKKRRTKKQ